MEKKQTAVKWLYDRLKLSLPEEMKVLRGLVVVAKEMEKEQMSNMWIGGQCAVELDGEFEQYYNKTYK